MVSDVHIDSCFIKCATGYDQLLLPMAYNLSVHTHQIMVNRTQTTNMQNTNKLNFNR